MSRRRVVIGMVVAMSAALIAGGSTFAAASPHADAAKKHHKGGPPASGCGGKTSPYLPGDPRWDLSFSCKHGSFSQFKVSTDHVIYRVFTGRTVIGKQLKLFKCQIKSSTSFSCSGAKVTNEKVYEIWQVPPPSVGNPQCKADPERR